MKTPAKIIIAILVIVAISVGVWLAAPLFYDKQISEDLPPEFAATPAATAKASPVNETQTGRQGAFSGFDATHTGSGTTRILSSNDSSYVRFEEDFQVTNGPDLYVYLGNNGQYDPNTNLGRLKGNIGSQNYEIPAGIDPSQYNEIWVWCRAFSVPFAKAVLK